MAEIKDKERILTAARKKQHVTYKGTPIQLSADFQQKLYRPVHFQGKPFNITVIQVYASTTMPKKLKLNDSMKTYKTF